MASRKHSQDRTVWVLHRAEGGDALTFDSEADAFECWSKDTCSTVDSFNPIEGWSRPCTDEFHEWLIEDERPIAPTPRLRHATAYSALRVAG